MIKRLGMQDEFRNWIKQRKTLPRMKSIKEIKVGDKVAFVDLPSFKGYTGIVTNIESDKVWLQYGGPNSVHIDKGYFSKDNAERYLRFI